MAVNRAGTELPPLFAAMQRSKEQVEQVKQQYKDAYKDDLKERLDDELSGVDWKRALAWLEGKMTPRRQLEIACEGLGTDVDLIWEALSGASTKEKEELGKEFAAHGAVYTMLEDEINAEEMERVGAILSGKSDALTLLKAAGGFDGDAIMKAFKSAPAEQLAIYGKAYNEHGAFMNYVDPKVDAADQAHIPTILTGTPEARLRAAIGWFCDDEDYVFHALDLIRGDEAAKQTACVADTALMRPAGGRRSARRDFRKVETGAAARRHCRRFEERAKQTRRRRPRASAAHASATSFQRPGTRSTTRLRELRDRLKDIDRPRRPDGRRRSVKALEQQASGQTQGRARAPTSEDPRRRCRRSRSTVVTTAVGIIVGVLTAGAGAAAIAAAAVGAGRAAGGDRGAWRSAVARGGGDRRPIKGDQFDVLRRRRRDRVRQSASIDGVTSVLGARGGAERLLNPGVRVQPRGEAAKEAAGAGVSGDHARQPRAGPDRSRAAGRVALRPCSSPWPTRRPGGAASARLRRGSAATPARAW